MRICKLFARCRSMTRVSACTVKFTEFTGDAVHIYLTHTSKGCYRCHHQLHQRTQQYYTGGMHDHKPSSYFRIYEKSKTLCCRLHTAYAVQ